MGCCPTPRYRSMGAAEREGAAPRRAVATAAALAVEAAVATAEALAGMAVKGVRAGGRPWGAVAATALVQTGGSAQTQRCAGERIERGSVAGSGVARAHVQSLIPPYARGAVGRDVSALEDLEVANGAGPRIYPICLPATQAEVLICVSVIGGNVKLI